MSYRVTDALNTPHPAIYLSSLQTYCPLIQAKHGIQLPFMLIPMASLNNLNAAVQLGKIESFDQSCPSSLMIQFHLSFNEFKQENH